MKTLSIVTVALLQLGGAVCLRAADSVVVFNEVHYHQVDELNETEWVELHSLMGVDVDISGWELEGGVNYTFPDGTVVRGHGYLVVAANPGDPSLAGTGALGPFVGRLANNGESIRLVNNSDRTMDSLSYGDAGDWPVGADGLGATLSKRAEETAEGRPFNWAASVEMGGTPGAVNFPQGVPQRDLVFSEIASAADPNFRIELSNVSEVSVVPGAYELRSSSGDTQPLPGVSLLPGAHLVMTPAFAVSDGDRLALVHSATNEMRDARGVTNRLRGLSGDRWLYPTAPTFGGANLFGFQDEVVINEIMYNHRSSEEQWIELYNKGSSEIDLGGWRFEDGVAFEFPAGTLLGSDEYIVVARDAAALAVKYPDLEIAGEWAGSLSAKGERLRLVDANKNPADEVRFSDGGRWSSLADGGGSSLELRHPRADNSAAESWAASVESGEWQTVSYRGPGTVTPNNDPRQYHEFIFGLLNSGEFLIDDVSVIEDPFGNPRELIQNGDFSSGTASAWRMRGNHRHAEVVSDPDDAGNQVLRVRATGAMEHMHNHAETTLKFGGSYVNLVDTRAYEISFRARWLSGSNQLNSRLYFNRLARTTLLPAPDETGTPGAPNSRLVANIGPTYSELSHAPAVPAANAPATVRVRVEDPDGVAEMDLFYAVNGGAFNSVTMDHQGEGRYAGVIPPQAGTRKVQFYIRARDQLGATEHIPAGGESSRAIIPWDDGRADLDYGNCQPNNFRIVMTTADTDFMHTVTEVMSNDRLGCTVIYNEREIYYDCGVRLKGSQRGRAKDVRVGFNVGFPDDQPFLGCHETVAVDRSGAGDQFSQKEILVKKVVNRAGGVPGMEDDLIRIIAPRTAHTGSAMLLKSRFDDEWLENQFPNGDDGTMFEYELIYYPTSTTGGPEGDKRPNPDSVAGVPMRSVSPQRNKELFRYHWQIENNKDLDDYDGLMDMLEALGQSGSAFRSATDDLLDVDQWLRSFAVQVLCGIGDNYSRGSQHNALFYLRPTDGKAMYFPWDMDFSFNGSATGDMTPNGDLDRLIAASPANERAYYGHLLDIITTSFNRGYLTEWAEHYSCFLPLEDLTTHLSFINTRFGHARTAIRSAVGSVPYRILTANGTSTSSSSIEVRGDAWVNVRELRLAGGTALPVTWIDDNTWQVTLPVSPGENNFTIEAVGFDGGVVGEQSVTINGSGTLVPATAANLAISELMYHPGLPSVAEGDAGYTDEDLFEFVELQNLSLTETLDLTGLSFVEGIVFELPAMTLAPGGRVIVAGDVAAFTERYGQGLPVIGPYQVAGANRLANGGERLRLDDGAGIAIADLVFDQGAPWPESADGEGYSLILMCPGGNDPADPQSWRSSAERGGNPGSSDTIELASWMASHGVADLFSDDDGDRLAALLEFATGQDPNRFDAADSAEVVLENESGQFFPVLEFRQVIGADEISLEAQGSVDLEEWLPGPLYLGRRNNGDGTSTVRFGSVLPTGAGEERFLRIEALAKP